MSGDNCLAGNWTLKNQTSTLVLPSSHVPVSGLAGVSLRIAPSGLFLLNYDNSASLNGKDGSRNVSQTLRGTLNFRLHAQSRTLDITPIGGSLIAIINDGGRITTSTLADSGPQTYAYQCSSTSLDMKGGGITQTFVRTK